MQAILSSEVTQDTNRLPAYPFPAASMTTLHADKV